MKSIATTTTYASARIDGVLDCSTLKVGVLKTSPQANPVVTFHVIAGIQRHPVWALDRLAAIVFCYVQAVKQHNAELHRDDGVVEVTLSGNLVSGVESVCVVAQSINWHTSSTIRNRAEAMVAEITGGGSRSPLWPFTEPMQLPLQAPTRRKP